MACFATRNVGLAFTTSAAASALPTAPAVSRILASRAQSLLMGAVRVAFPVPVEQERSSTALFATLNAEKAFTTSDAASARRHVRRISPPILAFPARKRATVAEREIGLDTKRRTFNSKRLSSIRTLLIGAMRASS